MINGGDVPAVNRRDRNLYHVCGTHPQMATLPHTPHYYFPPQGKKGKKKEKSEAAGRTRGMMRGAWLGSDDDDSWASRASDGHGEGSPRWMLPVVVVVMGGVRDVGVASFVI